MGRNSIINGWKTVSLGSLIAKRDFPFALIISANRPIDNKMNSRHINIKQKPKDHSVLRLSAGFICAALIAWKLTVNIAIVIDNKHAIANTHNLMVTRYS